MLKSFIEGLTQEGGFLRVRSVIALTVIGVYVYTVTVGSSGVVPVEDIKEITLLVVAFYFITRAAQGALGGKTK